MNTTINIKLIYSCWCTRRVKTKCNAVSYSINAEYRSTYKNQNGWKPGAIAGSGCVCVSAFGQIGKT